MHQSNSTNKVGDEITIRLAEPTDITTLVDFNQRLAEESEDHTLDAEKVFRGVSEIIARPELGHYYVAIADQTIVAQTMITREWSDWRAAYFWWIQSVYVRESVRRQGLFTLIFRHVERDARASQCACGLRLYVDKENHGAIETYRRLSMTPARYLLLEKLISSDDPLPH